MSFQDLESGKRLPGVRPDLANGESDFSRVVFQIATNVGTVHGLVNKLGTPKDTPQHRERLHKTRLQIRELVKVASANFKQASEADRQTRVSATKKIEVAKRARDFDLILKDFQRTQQIASEKETAYAPFVPLDIVPSSYPAAELEIRVGKIPEERALLVESKRQALLQLENEIVLSEIIIEEREQGIQKIQQQIGDANEIFKDIAVLVHEQGFVIDDIEANIEDSHSATVQANTHLVKAAKTQKSNSSLVAWFS